MDGCFWIGFDGKCKDERRERDRWRDLLEQNSEYERNKGGGKRVRQDEGDVKVEIDGRRRSKRGINTVLIMIL